jgi:hypothetical protein
VTERRNPELPLKFVDLERSFFGDGLGRGGALQKQSKRKAGRIVHRFVEGFATMIVMIEVVVVAAAEGEPG